MKWAYVCTMHMQEHLASARFTTWSNVRSFIIQKFLWIFVRRTQIQVAVATRVARLIAALRTARAVNMVATISNLSTSYSNTSTSSNRRIIRGRRSSAVRVSVKSVSVIGLRTTERPATTRGSPRGRADPRETVVTSVTWGSNRTPMRRRQNTWDSTVIPWWTVLRVWTICAITWTPLPSAVKGRPGML